MENLRVLTTQNVAIDYEIASVGDRYVAAIIDYLIIFGYILFVVILFNWLEIDNLLYQAKVLVPLALPILFYHFLSEWIFEGQSIGKKVRKLKVVRLDGSPVSVGDYLLRWFLGMIEATISAGGIAILAIVLSGRGQRIGDMAAGTTVVNLRRRLSIEDALLWQSPKDQPIRYQAAQELSDQDIDLIKEVLTESQRANLQAPMYHLQTQLQKRLRIAPDALSAEAFLQTIIKDYNRIYG